MNQLHDQLFKGISSIIGKEVSKTSIVTVCNDLVIKTILFFALLTFSFVSEFSINFSSITALQAWCVLFFCGSGITVSAFISRSSSLGSRPNWGHCSAFLGKILGNKHQPDKPLASCTDVTSLQFTSVYRPVWHEAEKLLCFVLVEQLLNSWSILTNLLTWVMGFKFSWKSWILLLPRTLCWTKLLET